MATRPDQTEPKTHGLADHLNGQEVTHTHDGAFDHDHDDFEADGPLEENPLWVQDNVALTSVGIDIGSSGTQVIFSRIHLRRLAEDLTSRYFVVKRETLFLSPVALTPYQSETRIDEAALKAIIDGAYRAGGIEPERHRHRRRHPDRRSVAPRERARQSRRCCRKPAAISSARPLAITWNRCSPPTVPARR